jgi:signal transduction histidine kinase
MLESSAEERGVTIDVGSEGPLPASGRSARVIQILVNLISKRSAPLARKRNRHPGFARTAGTASVTVSDQGPGIEGADQQRIFERFERAHTKEGGTGSGSRSRGGSHGRWAATSRLKARRAKARASP